MRGINLSIDRFRIKKGNYKKCPICKRKYVFNPDTNQMWCPYCGPNSVLGTGDIPWSKKHRFK